LGKSFFDRAGNRGVLVVHSGRDLQGAHSIEPGGSAVPHLSFECLPLQAGLLSEKKSGLAAPS
jgi:hypothetical protein